MDNAILVHDDPLPKLVVETKYKYGVLRTSFDAIDCNGVLVLSKMSFQWKDERFLGRIGLIQIGPTGEEITEHALNVSKFVGNVKTKRFLSRHE